MVSQASAEIPNTARSPITQSDVAALISSNPPSFATAAATADIPAGTGLGSSGSFTVGRLRAIYAFGRDHVSAADVADEACRIAINRLGRPVGKQDQCVAAFGGLRCFTFEPDGRVTEAPLKISADTFYDIEEQSTAGALRLAHESGLLESDFLVLYCDSWLQVDPGEVLRSARSRIEPAMTAAFGCR